MGLPTGMSMLDTLIFTFWVGISVFATLIGAFILKSLYNISPLHPLSSYPGPFFNRLSRLPASMHHARGDLYQQIALYHQRYGPVVRVAPNELSFSDPAAWQPIYNSRPQLTKSVFHFGQTNDAKRLPDSMIVAPDAEHMRLRRLVGPAFLMGGILEVEGVLQHYSDMLCAQLQAVSEASKAKDEKGEAQNMVDWFLWTLNDVIGQLALDQEFQCLEKQRMHPWPAFLLKVLKQTAFFNQLKRFRFPLWVLGPLLPKKVIEQRDGFFLTAQKAVRERLAREEKGEGDVEAEEGGGTVGKMQQLQRPDIIGMMLREMKANKNYSTERLTEPEIMANSILIVGGGAETTSTCLSATLYHLCKFPRAMKKLQAELRSNFESLEEITIKKTSELPYLKAVIDESLRIFPVASYISPRVVGKGGAEIAGRIVPEGSHVSQGQWYMGRSERFFDDPKEFRPERWLTLAEGEKHEFGYTSPHHQEGIDGLFVDEVLRPFSLGPRNCVGKLLAVAEARLVTAKLLWKFDVELDGPQDGWVDGARFYILWELQPLMVKLKAIR